MKRGKKILLSTLGASVLIVLVLFTIIFDSMRPTAGQRIPSYENPHTALLIIDIQEDYTGLRPGKNTATEIVS